MKEDQGFAISIGLVDGLITSLVITSGAIVGHSTIGFYQSLRIAFGSSFVGAISFFIAQFSKLSKDEYRIARVLKPGSSSVKIHPSLTGKNLLDSIEGGSASLIMGFLGASIPLFSYSMLGESAIVSLLCSYSSLGVFGIYTSKISGGKSSRWLISLILLGIIMTFLGYNLKIVS